jgi:RND family efflux transporter MFP subunit
VTTPSIRPTPAPDAGPAPSPPPRRRRFKGLILAALILLLGLGVAQWMRMTKPKARQQPPRPMQALAEWIAAEPAPARISVHAQGVVMPAQEITLQARVTGEALDLHPELIPGGRLRAGDAAVTLDPKDYEWALQARIADFDRAGAELRIEEGQRDIAAAEWARVAGADNEPAPDLALRGPQLQRARAAVAAAAATRDLAAEQVQRTVVRAPFNAIVRARLISPGAQVTPQTPLATLAGTDEFWIDVSIPADRLPALLAGAGGGAEGSTAVVRYGGADGRTYARAGEVLRVLPDVEPVGRTARAILRVADPLEPADGAPPMLLGSYVRGEIEGRLPDGVTALTVPRTALREGDTVWIWTPDDRLEIRSVTVLWREPDTVLVGDGLAAGERVIVTDIANPIPGLPLKAPGGGAAPAGARAPAEAAPEPAS